MFRYLWLVTASFLVIATFSCKQTATQPSDTSERVVAKKETPDSSSIRKIPSDEKETSGKKNETETIKTKEDYKSKEKVTQRPLPMGVPKPLTTPQGISSQDTQTPQENKDDFKPTPLPGKGAKAIKKKPVKLKTKPSTPPIPGTKIVALIMKPPASEHQY